MLDQNECQTVTRHINEKEVIAPGLTESEVAFWEFGILDNFGRFVFRHEELRWITR
jgi:hypothetical protein